MAFVYAIELVFDPLIRERPELVSAHGRYWQERAAAGVLLSGGEFADGAGELLLCRVGERSQLDLLLESDPYVEAHGLRRTSVREMRMNAGPAHGVPAPAWPPVRTVAQVAGSLTAHEERIARMMLRGSTNWQIAERLGVSTRAVELHITRMYRKLGIARRAQLAAALPGPPPLVTRNVC